MNPLNKDLIVAINQQADADVSGICLDLDRLLSCLLI